MVLSKYREVGVRERCYRTLEDHGSLNKMYYRMDEYFCFPLLTAVPYKSNDHL